jgi:hypothetical protein
MNTPPFKSALLRFALLLILAPLTVLAGLEAKDLPATSTWYFHADLSEMRRSESGASLYAWLEKEVFAEVKADSGIDLGKEVDQVTAFSSEDNGAVMVVSGRFSQQTRDKALAAAATADRFEMLKANGHSFYYVQGKGEIETDNIEIDGIGNEFYFSFDLKDKLIVAAEKEQLLSMLDNQGKISGARSNSGALFVLTAERSLLQAGVNTDRIEPDDDGFQSNILRNTKQVALMIADVAGKIAIEARLEATAAETAQSLASIVRGLIALQAFSDDMDPKVSQLLQATRVDVQQNTLKISVALSPEAITAALDEV